MGLFTGLLTLPIAPLRGVAWVAEQVASEADRELYDPERIRSELLQLELEADDGSLSELEREEREADLFERLRVARERERHARELEAIDG